MYPINTARINFFLFGFLQLNVIDRINVSKLNACNGIQNFSGCPWLALLISINAVGVLSILGMPNICSYIPTPATIVINNVQAIRTGVANFVFMT